MKPGTKVRMINCLEAEKYKDKIWTVRSEPWEACGSQLVLLEGYGGGFDVERLEIVGINRLIKIERKMLDVLKESLPMDEDEIKKKCKIA